MKQWQPSDGTNPYGKPERGNGGDLWQKMRTPCPTCGATEIRITVDKNDATVICGNSIVGYPYIEYRVVESTAQKDEGDKNTHLSS